MADDPKFSKEVENKDPRSLDEFQKDPKSRASEQFKQAKEGQQQEQQSPQRQDSEQVKKQQHGLNEGPKAPGELRRPMKSQEHNNDMAKDDRLARAQQINDSANKNKENQHEQNKDKER